jgi:hypothetical protein
VVTTTDGEWLIPPRVRGRGGRFFYPATFSANITTGQVGTSSPRNAASSWRLRPSGVSQASLMASLTSGMLPRPLLMHPDERDTRDGFHDESPNRVLFSVATSSKSTLLEEIGSVMSRIGQLSDKDCLECSSKSVPARGADHSGISCLEYPHLPGLGQDLELRMGSQRLKQRPDVVPNRRLREVELASYLPRALSLREASRPQAASASGRGHPSCSERAPLPWRRVV